MIKRQHYIALGLVLVVTLVMLDLPGKISARLKLGIGSIFVPLFSLASSSKQVAEQAGGALLPRSALLKENETLQRKNQELTLQANRADEIARENERLRRLVGWQRAQTTKYKLASVVLRDPANWWGAIQIDLGSRDGVRTNMPVVITEGLVGRVASVGLTRSQVLLLGDRNCKVAARVENETRDTGIVGPSSRLDNEFVELAYLSGSATLKPGQIVCTSGDGALFPKGVMIGKVVDSYSVEYGLSTVARVKLAANLNALEEVWVLFEP